MKYELAPSWSIGLSGDRPLDALRPCSRKCKFKQQCNVQSNCKSHSMFKFEALGGCNKSMAGRKGNGNSKVACCLLYICLLLFVIISFNAAAGQSELPPQQLQHANALALDQPIKCHHQSSHNHHHHQLKQQQQPSLPRQASKLAPVQLDHKIRSNSNNNNDFHQYQQPHAAKINTILEPVLDANSLVPYQREPGKRVAACQGCLAIPLISVDTSSGAKQLNGFILSPSHQVNRRRTIDAHDDRYQSYASPEQHYQPLNPLRPHSSAQCPMKGLLTVCQDIGHYPADLILNKLERSRRILKQSYFNIDSLFSDERDHLGEPFKDGEDSMAAGTATAAQEQARNSSLAKLMNDHHHSAWSPHHNVDGHNDDDRGSATAKGGQYTTIRQQRAAEPAGKLGNEFIDLVERRAISLEADAEPSGSARISQVAGPSSRDWATVAWQQQGNGDFGPAMVNINEKVDRRPNVKPAGATLSSGRRWKKLKRSERQTTLVDGAERQAIGGGNSSQTLNPTATLNPSMLMENINDANDGTDPGDDLNQIEAACRAKSIYISPRAAVSSAGKHRTFKISTPRVLLSNLPSYVRPLFS